jgi:hypothetical protein
VKLYRIDYGDCEGFKAQNNEQTVEWTGNLRNAKRIARENHDGDYHSRISVVDVPTHKSGLIEFLNRVA